MAEIKGPTVRERLTQPNHPLPLVKPLVSVIQLPFTNIPLLSSGIYSPSRPPTPPQKHTLLHASQHQPLSIHFPSLTTFPLFLFNSLSFTAHFPSTPPPLLYTHPNPSTFNPRPSTADSKPCPSSPSPALSHYPRSPFPFQPTTPTH